MIALPYDYYLIAWFVLSAASSAYVAFDQFNGNPEPTVMSGASMVCGLRESPANGWCLATSPSHGQYRRNYVSKITTIAALIMIATSLSAGAALAHPALRSAEPAAGAASSASPKQIKITFNENVMVQFSGVELKDKDGKMIPTGKATVDPANKKQLVVPVNETLSPGDYTVEWHAVSDDTHPVKGSYSFSVAP